MLSRIAESLFWIGRYTERSDGTARILDVQLQLLLEDPSIDEDTACRRLLAVMGSSSEHDSQVNRGDVLRILALDSQQISSIPYSVWAARENARRARDVLPSELWEALNQTNNLLGPTLKENQPSHELFRWVRERAALTIGIIESTVSRDDTWRFLTLGIFLERIDMTSRLLATRTLTEGSGASWTTILRSLGGHEAYQKTYKGLPSATSAAEFLLLDRLFPRSIVYSLSRVEECLRGLDPRRDRVGVGGDALRTIGQIRSELEYTPTTEILTALAKYMNQLQEASVEVAAIIKNKFFPSQVEPNWIGENYT